MTGLSFDVATYVLLSHLNPYPAFPKVQSDNITPAPWYSAMGAMVGKLYKRFPLLELRGLLNSLVTGLLKGSSFDLYLLQVRGFPFVRMCVWRTLYFGNAHVLFLYVCGCVRARVAVRVCW